MNKKYILYSIPVIIAAIVAGFFIFGRSNDAYVSMLPKNATALAHFDVKELVDDADLTATELYQLMTNTNDNPQTAPLGIDFQRPIYGFVSETGNLGLAAAVSDIDDLQDRLDEMHARGKASERTVQRGYEWVVLDGQWLMAFDSQKALAMGLAVGAAQDALRTEMATLLEQHRRESAAETPLFKMLQECDDPLAAIVAPEVLPSQGRKLLYQLGVRSQKDALLKLTLGSDDNELELNAHVVALTTEVKEHLKKLDSAMRPLKGTNLDLTHANNTALLAVNINGNSLVELLRSHTSTRTALVALNMILDLDQMLKAIDGDVALELLSPATILSGFKLSDISDFCLTAELSNTDFMERASTWGNDFIQVNALADNEYSLQLGRELLFFGTSGKRLYFSSSQGLTGEGNEYIHSKRDALTECRFYATFFAPALFSALLSQAAENGIAIPLPPVLQQFERFNITMKDAGDIKFSLIAPEGVNIAKELVKRN